VVSARSASFLVKVWKECDGEDWRCEIQHVQTGLSEYCRGMETARRIMEARLESAGHHGDDAARAKNTWR
jgi:hypothetical protein